MTDQLSFVFPEAQAATVESPLVILRWIEVGDDGWGGKVEAYWPDFKMTSWFRNWREALPIILHERNAHVRVRVRHG